MDQNQERRIGVLCALGAFSLWGFLPMYWKALVGVPPFQVLSHRILWSVPVLLFIVFHQGKVKSFRDFIPDGGWRDHTGIWMVVASTLLIGSNWFMYIWAVISGFVLETSLGYFISPLLNVFLGFMILNERLRPLQWLAVALAAGGVSYFAFQLGSLPWIALVLSFSFGMYGLTKKIGKLDALKGLSVETMILTIPCVAYLVWNEARGFEGKTYTAFFKYSLGTDLLLIGAGAATAIPMLLFGHTLKRLPLATVGFFQYMAPSIQFFLAIFLYREPFTHVHAVTFGLIWSGLALYTFDSFRAHKLQPIIINE